LNDLGQKSGRIAGYIINNLTNEPDPDYVSGASVDVAKLKEAWDKVNIDLLDLVETISAFGVRSLLRKLSTKDFSSFSGIFLTVLSHGAANDAVKFQNSGDGLLPLITLTGVTLIANDCT
jgi:hypothetical protein